MWPKLLIIKFLDYDCLFIITSSFSPLVPVLRGDVEDMLKFSVVYSVLDELGFPIRQTFVYILSSLRGMYYNHLKLTSGYFWSRPPVNVFPRFLATGYIRKLLAYLPICVCHYRKALLSGSIYTKTTNYLVCSLFASIAHSKEHSESLYLYAQIFHRCSTGLTFSGISA